MLIYFLAASCALLFILCLFFWSKFISANSAQFFLQKSLEDALSENAYLSEQNIQYIQQIEKITNKSQYQAQLIEEFENLKKDSLNSTKSVLFELGNKLSQQLIDIHKQENKEANEQAYSRVQETSQKFNSEFEKIVQMVGALNKEITQSKDTMDLIKNSLLSPSGAGYLAEITLENLLKSSSLQQDIDFVMQYSIMNDDTGSYARPDCVIFLPADKVMIVDAKASKFLLEHQSDGSKLSKTMNAHLKSLSSKSYADLIQKDMAQRGIRAKNAIVVMFLPSDQVVERVLDADKDFLQKAWQQDIFVVGPTGLMNILSLARVQIAEQKMVENHLKILEEVKNLLASINVLTRHSAKIGTSITSLVSSYDKFASSFNHNFLSKANKLQEMGLIADTNKDAKVKKLSLFMSKSELIDINSHINPTEEEETTEMV